MLGKHATARRRQEEDSKEVSSLSAEPPAGFTAEEWQAIREKNAAGVKQAEPKPSSQQLLHAAEKAERRRADLDRQLAAAREGMGKLEVEL